MFKGIWPTPEQMAEMLENTAEDRTRVTLTVPEAVLVLGIMALARVDSPDCDAPDCETCNVFNTLFWEISNALPMAARIRYQKALRESGIELPPSPWELVAAR